jgi:hypothetical protein
MKGRLGWNRAENNRETNSPTDAFYWQRIQIWEKWTTSKMNKETPNSALANRENRKTAIKRTQL